jgi:hypothetical protein
MRGVDLIIAISAISTSPLSLASPGDQPAKNRVPFDVTGVVQQADGMPSTNQVSSPDLTS